MNLPVNLQHTLTYHYRAVPRDMICAPDAISQLCDTLDQVMAYKAMIICGPTILRHANVVQRVQEALGERCAGLYAGVLPHAPVAMLAEAFEAVKVAQPEALVSVGGGSSHDTAKGLATLLAQGGRIHDYETRFTPPDQVELPHFTNNKIPVIAVSTTMGAAELSGGAGFTDHELSRKIVVADPWTMPRSVLIDGQALATTPLSILRSTAIGQFRIAVESICSPRHNPIGDAMGTAAIRMLVRYLPTCSGDDVDSLLQVKTAACMASLANVGGLGLCTATAHHVGGLFNVAHGEANGILLPHTMRFNLEACADRQALIAEAIGLDTAGMTPEAAGLAAADAVATLCQTLGLPSRLRDVDVPEAGLERIATATLHDRGLATNPKPVVDAAPILQVLRQAW